MIYKLMVVPVLLLVIMVNSSIAEEEPAAVGVARLGMTEAKTNSESFLYSMNQVDAKSDSHMANANAAEEYAWASIQYDIADLWWDLAEGSREEGDVFKASAFTASVEAFGHVLFADDHAENERWTQAITEYNNARDDYSDSETKRVSAFNRYYIAYTRYTRALKWYIKATPDT